MGLKSLNDVLRRLTVLLSWKDEIEPPLVIPFLVRKKSPCILEEGEALSRFESEIF